MSRRRSASRSQETGNRKPGILPISLSPHLPHLPLTYPLLALLTALLCLFISPVLATPTHAITLESQSATLVQQGKDLYEAGQYAEAIAPLEQAAQAYQAQGDSLRQAMTLSNLSLAYQQLGRWNEATETVTESLTLLSHQQSAISSQQSGNSAPASPLPIPPFPRNDRLQILAQTLDIQGRLQLSLGQAESALETWQQAASTYAKIQDKNGEIRSRINQAQALQTLGLYRRALVLLTELNQTLQTQPDSLTKAVGLRSLGDALQRVSNLDQAQTVLEQSLAIAQRLRSAPNIGNAQLSLGNTLRAQAAVFGKGDPLPAQQATHTALTYYQNAATSSVPITQIQAQLNRFSLLLENARESEAQAFLPQIQAQLKNLPPSRSSVYAHINLAQSLGMRQGQSPNPYEAATLLATAAQQAQSLQDPRAEAYALGSLGALYEKTGQLVEAQGLTDRALVLAQMVNAPDITYRWQWQLGRLLKAQGEVKAAIAAYDAAVATLQSIRGDLVAVNRDLQFSFRESVEPVYRESVALLLQSDNLSEKTLDKARQRIESLQLAELDNFFREACLNAQTVVLDQVVDQDNPTAAILYPIILPERLEVIVKIPRQPLQHYAIAQNQTQVEAVVTQLRQQITEPDALQVTQSLSHQVYDWLIQPIAPKLEQSGVNTLVFVLDGALRSVPMAALYDGEQYLIEKYAVALSVGLQLFDPKPLARGQLKALAAGLIQPPPGFQNFPPLPEIKSEFDLIAQAGVPTQTLLEKAFTSKALGQEINATDFNIIHLATHGQFSSQAKDTFILAADGPINVNQLDTLLRSRDQTRTGAVELLVLSACQTAAGDSRATLGLAGVAVRAGARSTLASLWQIDDRSTALFIGEFYRELAKGKVTKAEAVRRAQLNLLHQYQDYSDPGYWAPYVLIGNWL